MVSSTNSRPLPLTLPWDDDGLDEDGGEIIRHWRLPIGPRTHLPVKELFCHFSKKSYVLRRVIDKVYEKWDERVAASFLPQSAHTCAAQSLAGAHNAIFCWRPEGGSTGVVPAVQEEQFFWLHMILITRH